MQDTSTTLATHPCLVVKLIQRINLVFYLLGHPSNNFTVKDFFTRDYSTLLTNNSNCLRLPLTTWSTFYSMSSTRLSSKLLMVFAFSLFSPVLDWPVYIFNCRHDNVCRWLAYHKSYNLCIYFSSTINPMWNILLQVFLRC